LKQLEFDLDMKALRFVKKTGLFTKYCYLSRPETYLFVEEGIETEDDTLEKLTDTL
jgi:hypothetical protein